ncbi:unnamed protein product [Agarophyton chilense]|eukprot:gb/GEZJ01003881.1/.p1 GENE.gb/GEZJ01003881.1/~~gb/GEZJ01003881.1/.p1  ORF type:complete len:781 (-),score=77.27 gb/GEZJ01003881.1/:262-2604(-)
MALSPAADPVQLRAEAASSDVHESLKTSKQKEAFLRTLTLALICLVSFSIRLFSILRYESIIHEFDPWFNFRSTRVLVEEGTYKFWNWFDSRSWYPLGRIVGGTVYPGIMYTAAFMYNILHILGFQVNIRDVCVLTAPTFSALTALSAYALTKEAADTAAGIVAAAIVSIVPGYISRSVAGSYDNEGVAITAMIFCFYLWTKSVNTGSLFWSGLATLSYLYMVACWGGYIFLINLIPVYVLVMLFTGRYSHRLYVAYNTFYVLGTLLSMQIRFVGFNAVQTYEHLGAFGTFGLINLYCVAGWVRSFTGPRVFKAFVRWLALFTLSLLAFFLVISLVLDSSGRMTGRIRTFLDPTYASKHIPIIASVSEHQPTAWGSYFFDLHLTVYLMPIGLYFCFKRLSDANMFLVTYGAFAVYFSGIMVRIMLVLAPAASMLSAIGISETLKCCFRSLQTADEEDQLNIGVEDEARSTPRRSGREANEKDHGRSGDIAKKSKKTLRVKKSKSSKTEVVREETKPEIEKKRVLSLQASRPKVIPRPVALFVIAGSFFLLYQYVKHAIWATSEAYSSPSIVLSGRSSNGDRVFFDDYREAYYWLRQNTPEDAKVMSWWDYGYQISGMANRTVIVDNNTWNNTHIATVGKAMNSPEEVSYKIVRKLDVDYVLVVFGGVIEYSGDDINKFLWMVRIGGSVDKTVQEKDYLSSYGGYTVDANAGPALRKSLMFHLCYYRFADSGDRTSFDRVRRTRVPDAASIKLKYFEEAFTSEHWMVRIYRVKKPDARGWV